MANPFDQFDAPTAQPGNPFDQFDPPRAPAPSRIEDYAKSIGAGLGSATMNTLGLPGDARSALSSGVDYLGGKLGVDLSPVKSAAGKVFGGLNALPTSEQIRSTVTDPIVSPDYKPQTMAGKFLKTTAEFGPGMLIGGPQSALARFATNVAIPAVGSEAAGQAFEGEASEPYARIAGALAAPSIAGMARRVVTPFSAAPTQQAMATALRAEGVPLTAGQATGSKPLQWAESVLGDTPGAGGRAARIMEDQAERYTGAALGRSGIGANRATTEVMDHAFDRIGGNFEVVGQRNNLAGDRQLFGGLNRVNRDYVDMVPTPAPVVANTITHIGHTIASNGNQLTGAQYNAFTSRLARQARGAKNDPQLQEALQGIRNQLDDAMERTLQRTGNAADMGILRNARREYSNLIVLEKALDGAGGTEGIVTPAALRSAVAQQNKRGYTRGRGDFNELARAGASVLKPLPQSGTAPRQNVMNLMQMIGGALGGGAGSIGGPGTAIAGAMAGIAAPAALGRALLSRPVQRYLSNQALPRQAQQNATRQQLINLLLSSGSLRNPPPAPIQ